MVKKEKDLLLQDLCARLPYGVKVRFYDHWVEEYEIIPLTAKLLVYTVQIGEIPPYLFPLSSMTEEQKKEYESIIYCNIELHCERYYNVIDIDSFEELQEFYHKYHFDYRGLIPTGLAIDATGLNIY